MSEKSRMALLNRNLRICTKTGKIIYGKKLILKQLRTGQGKLLVIANNVPDDYRNELLHHLGMQTRKTEMFVYPGSSWDLGSQIGRPHMVGAMLIQQAGDSKILEIIKNY